MAARPRINIISLCSGIGGLDLGVHGALKRLGFSPRTVCYVEGEAYASAVLVNQMGKGAMDPAPIWSDLKTFDAARWRGSVDAIVAGFPCQPFSLAGKGLAKDDPRHLWPQVLRVLKESGARLAFFENVPGLVRRGLRTVIEDLSCAGFNAQWGCHSAEEAGAIHKRNRLFIFAYSDSSKLWLEQGRRSGERGKDESFPSINGEKRIASNPYGKGKPQQEGAFQEIGRRPGRRPEKANANIDNSGCKEQWRGEPGGEFLAPAKLSLGRPTKPGILRGVHGVRNILDRLESGGLNDQQAMQELRSYFAEEALEEWKSGIGIFKKDVLLSKVLRGVQGKGKQVYHSMCLKKARSAGLPSFATMRKMWIKKEGPETSQRHQRCLICSVPLSVMPHSRRHDAWEVGSWTEINKDLHDLRFGVHELYIYESKNMQPGMSVKDWQKKRNETMASRIDRIRALGNAVVPQCAERAFRELWNRTIKPQRRQRKKA